MSIIKGIIDKIKDYITGNTLKICLIIFLLILYIIQFVFMYYIVNDKNENNYPSGNKLIINQEESNEEANEDNDEEYVYVDVKGSVKKPNVYRLLKGSRVNDAVNEAGGLLKTANTRFINLSKVLNDGDVIVIYSNDEIKKAKKANTIYVETPCVCEEIKNDSCYNDTSSNENMNLININTASLEQLMTLNGIGESKAKAIIEYRQTNGNFSKIEDIINVSGISETIYNKIKNSITV